jgi:flagellar hook-basal body complex protein FliE
MGLPIPIAPVGAAPPDLSSLLQGQPMQLTAPASTSFAQMLTNGVENVNKKLLDADNMVRAFALDDSIPVHQVMFAVDQAKSSLELALQVRARLLDGYQQILNMQL